MKLSSIRWAALGFTLALTCTTAGLMAGDAATREEEHSPVGAREICRVVRPAPAQPLCAENPDCDCPCDEDGIGEEVVSPDGTAPKQDPQALSLFYADPFPGSTHQAIEKLFGPTAIPLLNGQVMLLPVGVYLRLEDSSIWRIADEDVGIAQDWLPHDTLQVVAENSWSPPAHLWQYKYCLSNLNTEDTVRIKPEVGPAVSSPHRRWLYDINPLTYQVILNDGSLWDVSSRDSAEFSRWMPDDNIIIGVNTDWLSYKRPNLLINLSTNNWVRACWKRY